MQVNWDDANKACRCSNAANLVSIEDAELNSLVSLLSGSTTTTWIGGRDFVTEGTWTWSDGTAWSYTNWKSGQPTNGVGSDDGLAQNCAIMNTAGEWQDVKCEGTTQRQYMCEKPDSDQTQLSTITACSCDSGWTASLDTGKCYKRVNVISSPVDWSTADTACKNDGANLASVTSALENKGQYT